MKLPRAKGWWLAVLLPLAVIAGFVWWNRQPGALDQRLARYRAAGLPTTPAELDVWYHYVPDAENAAPPLLKAISAWRSTADPGLPTAMNGPRYPKRGEAWPDPMLAAGRAELVANAGPLAQIHAALERPRSRYPVNFKVGAAVTLPHLVPAREVARNLGLEARFAAETGDPERAASALLANFRNARTLAEEPLLLSYLVRLALIAIALEAAESVVSRTSLSETQLQALQQAFAGAETTPHLVRALAGERCLALDELHQPSTMLFAVFTGPIGAGTPANSSPQFLPIILGKLYEGTGLKGRDLEFYLDRLDELADAALRPGAEVTVRLREFKSHIDELDSWRGRLRPFSRQTLPAYASTLPKELRSVATLRSGQTAMAIERWRLAHAGALPPSLAALVPRYLSAIPEDPLIGQPLKFHPQSSGYVVYSVGEDGADDGGKERVPGTLETKGWDYTFTVAR